MTPRRTAQDTIHTASPPWPWIAAWLACPIATGIMFGLLASWYGAPAFFMVLSILIIQLIQQIIQIILDRRHKRAVMERNL